ncbi:MAG: hypothetical protein JW892_15120 [Anaerolineae bacterium]|nr:hypothetical protein [Anaerolineae bacterium]
MQNRRTKSPGEKSPGEKSPGEKSPWILAAAALVVGVGGLAFSATRAAPMRVITDYSLNVLADEAQAMHDCAECHEAEYFHTCDTCHDDHGAIEMENVPFYAGIMLEGDVPTPGYVLLDDILPYRDQPHTHLPLLDFLTDQGVTEFESVTLASLDGGFVTLTRENLTAEALLMPYEDGIRFAAENLHISSWIKGIRRIIVVGAATPLQIEGQVTSMGRLLLGPSLELTVEQTSVMLQSEDDGKVRQAQAGSRIIGAPLTALVDDPAFTQLVVRDSAGKETRLNAEETRGAVIAQLRGQVTLVLPERGRTQWITNIASLESK